MPAPCKAVGERDVPSVDPEQAARLVQAALHVEPRQLLRQSLTQSGNAVFQAILPDGKSAALRISPRPRTFAYTQHNLMALTQLGMPVQKVLAAGPTDAGGSFVILNWIAGKDLLYELPQLQPRQMAALARTVVDVQKRVGTLPQSKGFGWAPIARHAATPTWSAIFGPAPTAEEPPDPHAAPIDRLRSRLRGVRRSLEPYFATVRPICFLDDLTTKNAIIENGELRGIIDVDFVCYGDPLMSVGTTLASIATEVGEAGNLYADELVRCWDPSPQARRAIGFYAALWVVGLLVAADTAADASKVDALTLIADRMLGELESD